MRVGSEQVRQARLRIRSRAKVCPVCSSETCHVDRLVSARPDEMTMQARRNRVAGADGFSRADEVAPYVLRGRVITVYSPATSLLGIYLKPNAPTLC